MSSAVAASALVFWGGFCGESKPASGHGIHGKRRQNVHSIAVSERVVSSDGFIENSNFSWLREACGSQSIGHFGGSGQRHCF